jgi:hypothetical protein
MMTTKILSPYLNLNKFYKNTSHISHNKRKHKIDLHIHNVDLLLAVPVSV